MKPRTRWARQPVAFMISWRVAPFGRRISSRTSAFLLPSRASLPPLRVGAAFLAEVAFFLDPFGLRPVQRAGRHRPLSQIAPTFRGDCLEPAGIAQRRDPLPG